jgi:hypothetical protein
MCPSITCFEMPGVFFSSQLMAVSAQSCFIKCITGTALAMSLTISLKPQKETSDTIYAAMAAGVFSD